MSSLNTIHDDSLKHYSLVTKLVHYTSKFELNDDGRHSKQHLSTKSQRLLSNLDLTDKSNENRRFRLAPIWPEWNEAEISTETWDTGNIKKKETTSVRARGDAKTNISTVPQLFEDPEGKIELPPSFKVEQWKRPIDFLSPDKPPVIVDSDLGMQNFDLITSNEHLHYSETMRNIISQITSLWDICRKERKNTKSPSENINQSNIIERAWNPWEHLYALNKVSKQAFNTLYNPAGKYVVRLYFLGTWRKIIIDDTIPFDSQNRCLLPQTTLSYELWPMLLSKALLKIISLDFHLSNKLSEYSETSVIHLLTGWIPEPIPLKYTHAEKIWNFLRYDHSNKVVAENDLHSRTSFGPLSLFKCPIPKVASPSGNKNPWEHPDNNMTKKLDNKNSKKLGASVNLPIPKDPTVIKSANIKENRTTGSANPSTAKDLKKTGGTARGAGTEDGGVMVDDQITPEVPKMIVFATISHSQPTRISSYSETADRSERLRRYNLNETFSTSVLLTTIRDIPLEPPPLPLPVELIPAWKLIRPRKPKVLPHAEPIATHETKSERWIEIASPYINYPTASVLHIKPTIRPYSTDSNTATVNTSPRSNRSTKHSTTPNPFNIIEIDEDEDIENRKIKTPLNTEFVRSRTSLSLSTTKKELNINETQEKSEESTRSAGSKSKRKISVDKMKIHRKSAAGSTKFTSDTVSIKNKGGESEQIVVPIDTQIVGNNHEQQSSQPTNLTVSKKSNQTPKIWMDFADFCACFTSIIVFHNPRGYQYTHKHTEIKFTPYQPPVVIPITREKKKELSQPVVQPITNLPDDKSSLYLFVDSTREILEKNIELIISLTCLPRWYDALPTESIGLNEKITRNLNVSTDLNLAKIIVSQKEIIPQAGSLIAEIYSWKSLSIGQPILRLHTTATKAALVILPPGRHVLKLMNTCPFAFNLQILSDTHDFMLGDEDQLLNKIISVPEDADFIIRAEELFFALDDSIQNFHLINQRENKLHELFRSYCQNAPKSIDLTIQTCLNAFNQALYSTLRTIINTSGSVINADMQFAWRCFTNDLSSPDMLGAYEVKRPSATSATRHSARTAGSSSVNTGGITSNKKSSGGRDKSSDDKTKQPSIPHSSSMADVQEEPTSDWLTRELSIEEIDAITSIQKMTRGFLQRRIDLARKSGTEKNVTIQRALQSTMSLLKVDSNKSALLLFKNFIAINSSLIQCFSFRHDDWNMVTYRDYNGIYQEQSANTWFVLFREIFYVTEESFIAAKFLSHLSNSLLRVINNDTYEEMSLVFNRLAPGIFTKNKHGYTFVAEGMSVDQSIPNGRFRLRLITSYTQLPETRDDQITSSFLTNEILDYYVPNKQEILCRYRVIIADDINQSGRNFHLASIHFSTSKSDVFMRLTIFDNENEIVSVEGKGSVVLPAILFMRTTSNIIQTQSSARPTSKTTGTRKKDGSNTHRGSIEDLTVKNKDRVGSGKRSRSNSRTGLTFADEEEKSHKYILQVTLLRKSWPLTLTQWQFIEQVKEQEKNELKIFYRQPSSPTKTEKPSSKRVGQTSTNPLSTTAKGRSSSVKSSTTPTGRPTTEKRNPEKTMIDTNKPHWILRIISDADKPDELIIKKDTERTEELINMKKAWETFQPGRAEKAMQTRQKFLDSLQIKIDDQLSPEITDEIINLHETRIDAEAPSTITSSVIEQQQQVVKQIPPRKKKGSVKEEPSKQIELIPPQPHIDEPLLDEPPPPPPSKSKITLPSLDVKPFIKRKLSSNESIISDSIFEQEEFECRQNDFTEYLTTLNEIRQYREDDYHNRSKEKARQLEEYTDLQAKIDQIRRFIHEPRELFRQRFLEIERQRLEELAMQQQKLLEQEKAKAVATLIEPTKKKTTSPGKKKKK